MILFRLGNLGRPPNRSNADQQPAPNAPLACSGYPLAKFLRLRVLPVTVTFFRVARAVSFREKALHFRPPWCEGPRDPAPKAQLAKPSQLIPRLLPQIFEDFSVANELNYLAMRHTII